MMGKYDNMNAVEAIMTDQGYIKSETGEWIMTTVEFAKRYVRVKCPDGKSYPFTEFQLTRLEEMTNNVLAGADLIWRKNNFPESLPRVLHKYPEKATLDLVLYNSRFIKSMRHIRKMATDDEYRRQVIMERGYWAYPEKFRTGFRYVNPMTIDESYEAAKDKFDDTLNKLSK
jgi:hypothetical protein